MLFDGGKEILAGVRRPALAARREGACRRPGCEIQVQSIVTARRRGRGRGEGARRQGGAHRGPDEGLGGGRGGLSAREAARRGLRAPSATAPGASRCCPDCTLPGHPEVFAIGDMMALDDLPGVAEVAMQHRNPRGRDDQGAARGQTRSRSRSGTATSGSMASISRFGARSSASTGCGVSGFLGWLMWLFVHLAFMTGFKNRFTAVVGWGFSFLGQRAQRACDHAREARRRPRRRAISYEVDDAGGRRTVWNASARDRRRPPPRSTSRARSSRRRRSTTSCSCR